MKKQVRIHRRPLTVVGAIALVAVLSVVVVAAGAAIPALGPGTHPVANGMTRLTLDTATADALTAAGISVVRVPPTKARTVDGATVLNFPIGGGRLNLGTLTGTIRHGGGLKFVMGSARIKFTKFHIKLDGSATATVTARVNGHPKDRRDILTVDLTGITPTVTGKWVIIDGAPATLTANAATALNAIFPPTAPNPDTFTAGMSLGSVTVHVHVARGTVGGKH
jgi:hypothetical protein